MLKITIYTCTTCMHVHSLTFFEQVFPFFLSLSFCPLNIVNVTHEVEFISILQLIEYMYIPFFSSKIAVRMRRERGNTENGRRSYHVKGYTIFKSLFYSYTRRTFETISHFLGPLFHLQHDHRLASSASRPTIFFFKKRNNWHNFQLFFSS